MKIIKRNTIAALLMLCLTFAMQAQQSNEMEGEPQLIINLTSDVEQDPHSALMGMHLAQKSMKNGIDVTLFLNVHAVKLLLPESKDIEFHNENLREVLMTILEDGGTVIICPHCMDAHNVKKEDLPKGVVYGKDLTLINKIKDNPTVFTY